jgi:hypothetical protein
MEGEAQKGCLVGGSNESVTCVSTEGISRLGVPSIASVLAASAEKIARGKEAVGRGARPWVGRRGDAEGERKGEREQLTTDE